MQKQADEEIKQDGEVSIIISALKDAGDKSILKKSKKGSKRTKSKKKNQTFKDKIEKDDYESENDNFQNPGTSSPSQNRTKIEKSKTQGQGPNRAASQNFGQHSKFKGSSKQAANAN